MGRAQSVASGHDFMRSTSRPSPSRLTTAEAYCSFGKGGQLCFHWSYYGMSLPRQLEQPRDISVGDQRRRLHVSSNLQTMKGMEWEFSRESYDNRAARSRVSELFA